MILPENTLIQELKKGNAKAFEVLYDRYHARLYNFCFKITGNIQETEDLVHEVFVAIWENRGNLDESKSFTGFIFTIAKNKVLNRIKKTVSRQVYIHFMKEHNQDRNDLGKDFESQEFIKFLQKAVQEMPEKTRNIFRLSRDENMTYKEIAQKLNISENVVDHEIRKALEYIREQIRKLDSI